MAVLAACTAAAIASGTVPAFADGPGQTSTAAVVEKATGTAALAGTTATADSPASTVVNAVTVNAPANAAGALSATASDGTTVALSLSGAKAAAGVKGGVGTVVYSDAQKATDFAAQATTDGGARALITLKDSSAPTSQTFNLGLPAGASLIADGAGGYDIVQKAGEGIAISKGHIDAPWAKDATGKALPTHYTVQGDQLTQTIETNKSTAFPVVADPHFTWGIVSGTAYFDKGETQAIAGGGATALAVITAVGGPLDIVVDPIVTVTVAAAGVAVAKGECVKLKSYGIASTYSGQYCD
ncbi:hypothetical protein [Kitasatospora sp. NPDC059599]|uniref:hypothetical protein n=1 Tax=Kitasatospora sp. NPDC059599 TaxID=3346880 RepID=UPI0036958C25